MKHHTIKTGDGYWVSTGHFVTNFNTKSVIMGWHTELDGSVKPVLQALGVDGLSLKAGKWVAEPKFLTVEI